MTISEPSTDTQVAIYLGLGSNVGDREANLCEALERIENLGIEIVRESSIYETEPVGSTDQRWFLNQVIELKLFAGVMSECGPITSDPETIATVGAEALLSELLKIEREMGRVRSVPNGPRLIDIDVLLYGDLIIAHSKHDEEWSYIDPTDIFVPHPRMHERRFVLEPLCEIAPEIVHPLLEKTCREILASLDDPSVVNVYKQRSGRT
jgi:7,8-dihydro-6-hydroxymethylpterin-pyrophosphokinase